VGEDEEPKGYTISMGEIRTGPSEIPTRESPEAAIDALAARGYSACEIDFEGGFWLGKDDAARLGELAATADIALSIHAPLPAFLGHVEKGAKFKRAVGMLDHTAGIAKLCGAAVVVMHPGFLLGRDRGSALAAVAEQLGILRSRLLEKDRAVPFGLEMMGRVKELGTAEDVFWISERLDWVRPVIDFAHLHAVTDGGFVTADAFAAVLGRADDLLPPGAPFHIHFSDIAYANRNETKHLPYGEGTLRAEPLREALLRFERPATVISESPDEDSHQVIRMILLEG
jgi:deoxyribonuclease-4